MAIYQPDNLIDAQQFKAEFPMTVHAIHPTHWQNVELDFYVRLRSNNEYFWVQVTDIQQMDSLITGEVYYELGTNPYLIGDLIIFQPCHMFDIYDPRVFNLAPGLERTQYKRGPAISPL